MAELVRHAVDRSYAPDVDVGRRLAALRASAGVWADGNVRHFPMFDGLTPPY